MSEKMSKEGAEQGIFIRKASGLVRSFSLKDVLFFNLMGCSLGTGLSFIPMSAGSAAPNGDPVLAIMIFFIPAIFMALLFGLYTAAMPRSGGDYIYVSRTLHPALGFMSNWVVIVQVVYSLGFWANLVSTWALPPMFYTIGTVFEIPALVQLSSQITSLAGVFIIGTIFLAAFAMITTFARIGTFAKIQAALTIIGLIAMVVGIGILATTSSDQAIATFNNLASKAGAGSNYYQQVLTEGGVSVPVTLLGTFATWPVILAYFQWFIFPSAWVGGEIKKVSRSQIFGVLGAVVVGMGSLAVYIGLAYMKFGRDFINSAVSLFYYAPDKWVFYPLQPDVYMLSSILTNNIVFMVILGVGMVIWACAMMPMGYYAVSRCMLAWSFDRLMPERVADIHPKYHTPAKAILIAFVFAEISLVAYSLGPAFFSGLWIWVNTNFMLIVIGLAGLLFPFIKKDIYNASPISKYKIGSVPLISICGIVTAAINLWGMWYLFFDAGWNWSILNYASETIIIASFASAILIFYGARYYRKRKGIALEYAYREIPPE